MKPQRLIHCLRTLRAIKRNEHDFLRILERDLQALDAVTPESLENFKTARTWVEKEERHLKVLERDLRAHLAIGEFPPTVTLLTTLELPRARAVIAAIRASGDPSLTSVADALDAALLVAPIAGAPAVDRELVN